MFIPDPGSWFLPIPDPGSRIPDPKTGTKERGEKKFFCHTFLCSHKFHKIGHYFSFEVVKKKIWANFQRIIELFTQKIVTKLSKIWVWDPGSGIQDPGSGKNLFRIPDPGVKKAPDPGSGSATLTPDQSRPCHSELNQTNSDRTKSYQVSQSNKKNYISDSVPIRILNFLGLPDP